MKNKHIFKDFLPLLGIIVLVLVLTYFNTKNYTLSAMLAFMGWFFTIFGLLKIAKLRDFVRAYEEYDLLAQKSRLWAYFYPFLELFFGIAYLSQWNVRATSWIVLVVMLVGALGVFLKLKEKEEIPCACLGTVFQVPMTWVTFGEDLLMAAMAAGILFL